MNFATNHVKVDLSALPKVEVLNLDGMGLAGGLQRVADWHDLAATRVRQLLVSYSLLPADFFRILIQVAPHLTQLGLVRSELMGDGRCLARPPADFLRTCVEME